MNRKKNKVTGSPAEESKQGSSTSEVKGAKGKAGSGGKPPNAGKAPRNRETGEWAGPGSRNPERRCSATARRSGEQCKQASILGTVPPMCKFHGGSLPGVKKAAKERLLELVDPALAELHRVLTDKNADDAVKVRAALGILDRTGHGPGAKIEIGVSKWDDVLEDVFQTGVDRSLLSGDDPKSRRELPSAAGGGADPDGWEDYEQAALSAQDDIDRERHNEDGREYEAGRIRPDENTIRGEVVVAPVVRRGSAPPDPGPTDPPAYARERPARRP